MCQNLLGTKALTFTRLNLLYVLLLLWKSRSIIKSVRKEGRKEEQNCTLMASSRTPSTGALESFCEFFSCMQLEYCLREPLSKFEGLSTFYCNFINVNILYCICGTLIRPIPTIRTTVRIIRNIVLNLE